MTRRNKEALLNIIGYTIIIAFIIGLVTLMAYGIRTGIEKAEKGECYEWQGYAEDYTGFYITDWQEEQCDHYGIEIKIEKEIKYIEVMATVYSYNSLPEQTDDTPFIMASGERVYDGALACPSYLTFGTNVLIEGRLYTCEDRMHTKYRTGNNFDIWMPLEEDSKEWGVKRTLVRIFE